MKAHLKSFGLWQWVEDESGDNPMLNRIRVHADEEAKAPKLCALFMLVSHIQFPQEL